MADAPENKKFNQSGNNLNIGLLAHVDAGKTTLAEALLYTCGQLRRLGRVDHKDAFLDNFSIERERGITVFSKQAHTKWKEQKLTLLDTPGHVDFGAEMERTLQVLDLAVLVISGMDGVQGHTETLWRLLKRYEIPTFIFVNKMDREGTDREALLKELQSRLDGGCVDFSRPDAGYMEEAASGADIHDDLEREVLENIATCDEAVMEKYLECGGISDEDIISLTADRKLFPCFFGSALKLSGVNALLDGIIRFAPQPEYGEEFGARVFKITRDEEGNRLTHMKITGGGLRAKQTVSNAGSAKSGEDVWEEKADQIRIYNGAGFSAAEEVRAGEICAVKGLKKTFAGQGLGAEKEDMPPGLEPVLSYSLVLPEDCDPAVMLTKLKVLEEEIPELHIAWSEEIREIHVQVMGEVQTEILRSLIKERFGVDVSFGEGSIVYKETIAAPVEGIGHFEPLRHYAEVHLLMEPGERGSGLQFASLVSDDELDKNWQRLVLTHLEEKAHVGVLTGSQITDMRIVLVAGRAHEKHTEGGDFRQATYRAVRQGLMKAKNVLLEPVFSFTLELPTEYIGHAMSDIKRMYGEFDSPVTDGDKTILTGTAPVSTIRDYQKEVNTYTRGRGRLGLTLKGYEPCHNAKEVIEKIGYDPESDIANPAYSVFCSHGAGCAVEWNLVDYYAHVESRLKPEDFKGMYDDADAMSREAVENAAVKYDDIAPERSAGSRHRGTSGYITQEEIEEIFARTYGKKKEDGNRFRRYHKSRPARRDFDSGSTGEYKSHSAEKREDYLLVDGYNIIFAWDELRELSKINIDSARDKLVDIMCNYQGFTGATLILVFDAYKVKNNPGSVVKHNNIYVVYTKEAETADQYIEKTVHEIGRKYNVTVATSDRLEQMIIWGNGAMRMSAGGLKEAVEAAMGQMRADYLEKEEKIKNPLPK